MHQVLQDLILALRSSGVRISLSETLDAMKVVTLVGYVDRRILKDSLSVTLAKSEREKEIFDTCFERFFSPEGFAFQEAVPWLGEKFHMDEGDSSLAQMLLSGDQMGLSMAMREASQKIDVTGIRFFTQKGLYIQEILLGMGLEDLNRQIASLSAEKSVPSHQKAVALKQARECLFERVRDFVEKQLRLFAAGATEAVMEKFLKNARLSNLEQEDLKRLHPIIERMTKRLNDLHSRRRKRAKRGLLDFKKSLRKNLAYQGILFDPGWKRKKVDRPDILALCDVSRSVATTARFMLLFLYGLNEEVAKIGSFVFCSNLAEVSHIFRVHSVEEALTRLQKGMGFGIQLGRTDYGQAFRDFRDGWLDRVTDKTTIMILGDARNNYYEPETAILKLMYERSKRILWLNPEPPSFWGTGDSEMKRYMPCCTLVKECGTINHLERIVDSLLLTGG